MPDSHVFTLNDIETSDAIVVLKYAVNPQLEDWLYHLTPEEFKLAHIPVCMTACIESYKIINNLTKIN